MPLATVTPPVILLGGTANALSVAWTLGRRGIVVCALAPATAPIRYSRYSRWLPLPENGDLQERWLEYLTGDGAAALHGAVVLPCSDDGIELIARHRPQLQARFRLIEGKDEVLLAMLDKSVTYQWARRAGVAVPALARARTLAEALAAADAVGYPCGLKPRYSHQLQRFSVTKVFVVTSQAQLRSVFEQLEQHRLEVVVTEIIPGADDRLWSFYTYLDDRLEPLFHFTKRKLRQYPVGFGNGTYHISDWNPEVARLGCQFLQGVRLSGFANVEFKYDARDGRLKLIECNPRFTLVHEMLQLCGIDATQLVYNRLTGRPLPRVGAHRRGVRVIVPRQDYYSFREAHARGELSWMRWVGSLLHRQHVLYFRWSDPKPAAVHAWWFLRGHLQRLWGRIARQPRRALVTGEGSPPS